VARAPGRAPPYAVFADATTIAIGLLFFRYGARLSTAEAIEGLRQWRLHSVVLASTYVLFPILGLCARLLVPAVLTPELYEPHPASPSGAQHADRLGRQNPFDAQHGGAREAGVLAQHAVGQHEVAGGQR
jgi:hypothetical protein